MMGTIQQVVCIFLCHFIGATAWTYEDVSFPWDFDSIFENEKLFPFEGPVDLFPFDNILSSWRAWTPVFDTFPEFPPTMNAPRVQVFCDESNLTLLVDKESFGFTLTRGEIELGNGCYSNKELPNQFVFVYDLDECGTTPVLQNGMKAFTNSLNLNLKKATPTWWKALPSVYIYCIPNTLNGDADLAQTPVNALSFNIQAMDSSWTNTAETNMYERGNLINLQVSAQIGPLEQLFIQSCSVSASPEPYARPRHAVIMNKGCSSSLGSPHAVAKFVASDKADVVHFMLNTSNLISKPYIHCHLLVSDKGITSVSKSCNYDLIQSRWEELSGEIEVCGCCSSKCKGQSANLPEAIKGRVTIGPLLIVDNIETSPALPELEPHTSENSLPNSVQSVSSEPVAVHDPESLSNIQDAPQGVVVVRQDPAARLTLWLPGQVQPDSSNEISSLSEDLPNQFEQSNHASFPETDLLDLQNQIAVNDFKGDSLLDMILPVAEWSTLHKEPFAERFQRKGRLVRSGESDVEDAQAAPSLPTEMGISVLLLKKPTMTVLSHKTLTEESPNWMPADAVLSDLKPTHLNPVKDEQPPMQMEDVDNQPVIRTKLEFSKSADGSQTLSYEEVKQDGKCEKDTTRKRRGTRLEGLHSIFLNLLRKMNKAE